MKENLLTIQDILKVKNIGKVYTAVENGIGTFKFIITKEISWVDHEIFPTIRFISDKYSKHGRELTDITPLYYIFELKFKEVK